MIRAALISLTGFVVIFSIGVVATINPGLFAVISRVPFTDTILHFLLFGFLSATVVISFWQLGKSYVCAGVLVTIGYAITDEMMQQIILTRDFSLTDLIANLSGILVFSSIAIGYFATSREFCRGKSKCRGSFWFKRCSCEN